jgi:hypothetical protein
MAIAASNLTSGTATSVSSQATASISPTANQLVVVSVASQAAATANVPTVTGAGGTWVNIGTQIDASNTRRVTMFRDLSASPGSGALTIDFAAQSQTNVAWSIDTFSGTDSSGADGSGAIVQNVGNSTTSGATTSFAITLAALGSSNNAAYGYVRNNAAGSISAGASFTQLAQTTIVECESEWALNQVSVNWTWASQTVISVGLAIEIKAATVAAPVTTSYGLLGMP